jgi:hypothetical protein
MYLVPLAMDHAQDMLESILVFFEQIGYNDGDAAADAHHAVYEHICFFSGFLNEVECGGKMLAKIVILVVLGGNPKIVRDVFLGVSDKAAASDREDGPDALTCMA